MVELTRTRRLKPTSHLVREPTPFHSFKAMPQSVLKINDAGHMECPTRESVASHLRLAHCVEEKMEVSSRSGEKEIAAHRLAMLSKPEPSNRLDRSLSCSASGRHSAFVADSARTRRISVAWLKLGLTWRVYSSSFLAITGLFAFS
jgi:hypothetical protein